MRNLCRSFVFCITFISMAALARAEIIIAEGESFTPLDKKGWKITHQQDSYGSHTYGGMWMSQGGCLGAPADSAGAIAKRTIVIKDGGAFRVWSKYQAPPYFNYLHKVEIVQNGKTVFSHVYGKKGTDRLWSFSGVSDELWWPWGVDHDCAEAPKATVTLKPGAAEIRLITVAQPKPAGDRFVDFLVLTTNLKDEYKGFKPYSVGSPFAFEALDATKLFLRFKNTSGKFAFLSVSRAGHFQPNYGGGSITVPNPGSPKAPLTPGVAPGQWSEWFNIGPFCRLVHDEGLTVTLPGAATFDLQFARDPLGKTLVGDMKAVSGEPVVVPIDITWQKNARVRPSRDWAAEIIKDSKTWRKANGGKKPKEIAYYGAFSGNEDWVHELKATLGYNTMLPAKYEQLKRGHLHAHTHSIPDIEAFAKRFTAKDSLRVLSFGDEISLGNINFKDANLNKMFRVWLKTKGITKNDLGVEPGNAVLTAYSPGFSRGSSERRLAWWSQQFNEEERFAAYRAMTARAKELFGKDVLTGANYSPHHGCLYYGPIYQWVDIFKHKGMSMIWAEDYIFSVPEVPQIISWSFAQMRCAAKYHNTPIHYYVMPHAPGQEPGFLRRNMVLSIGFGARHIDNFWVAPAERYTENYVSWKYKDTFRVLSESIYDSAEVEKFVVEGKVRPAQAAIIMSKATDYNESRLMVPKAKDPFAAQCKNAPAMVNQTLCRKEQQMLYLALRHAQHAVDCITEEDILEGYLKNLKVVYFAGEWIDNRIIPKLEEWVKAGGVLYCCGGCGHKNQYDEPEPAMLKLLGLKSIKTTKNAYHMRTLLELPLAEPMDTFGDVKLPAVGMKQVLAPGEAKVYAKWSDGSAAVTTHAIGKGHVVAAGALTGTSTVKTAVRPIPWARGGRYMPYNPVSADLDSPQMVTLGTAFSNPPKDVVASNPHVEGIVIDHKGGTLLTLVNWTNAKVLNMIEIEVRMKDSPKTVRTVSGQRNLAFTHKDGIVRFNIDLAEADYVVLRK
ncbi:MAG: hypothetical protein HYX68_00475 [Planctomycetes bacterium]|nr:hypothetical protein [Planctomycetota bacterium]